MLGVRSGFLHGFLPTVLSSFIWRCYVRYQVTALSIKLCSYNCCYQVFSLTLAYLYSLFVLGQASHFHQDFNTMLHSYSYFLSNSLSHILGARSSFTLLHIFLHQSWCPIKLHTSRVLFTPLWCNVSYLVPVSCQIANSALVNLKSLVKLGSKFVSRISAPQETQKQKLLVPQGTKVTSPTRNKSY